MMNQETELLAHRQERLHIVENAEAGVYGVIAIHSTALGPAAGGCRFWHYADTADLTADAVRLARGMSYKNALAGLPFGGGKAVLQRPDGPFDRQVIFRTFANAVAELDGRYITAEDVGTTLADMRMVRECTPYVAGLEAKPGLAGGDPSPWTALGVFLSMQQAAKIALGSDLAGLRVAVQGVGNVGAELCRLLKKEGAKLVIADIDRARTARLADELGAVQVDVDEIVGVDAEVYAPCALGGAINDASIERLKVRLVCGGANNQLATPAIGAELLRRGITYAPDYLVNAGGIINVAAEYLHENTDQVRERIAEIPRRLREVLLTASEQQRPPHEVADAMAEQIIAAGPPAA